MARLTIRKGKHGGRGGATRRAVETQIARIKKKMNQIDGRKPDDPSGGYIRSRAAMVDRLWVEWVRVRTAAGR